VRPVKVPSIQSHVAYGHVGNASAVFPLQRLGHEVWPVLTVHFSNHTGYGAWRGPLLGAGTVRDVVAGIEERGVLGQVDAVLSGYQGSPDVAAAVVEAVAKVKAANPAATYTCDPVMGNAGSGCFVDPAIPPIIREQVVPAADVITPNQFELGFLVGAELAGERRGSLDEVLDAAAQARAMGPSTVLVTSVEPDGAPAEELSMLTVTGDGAWMVTTPRLPMKANGSGDKAGPAVSSLPLGGSDAAAALARTASSVFDLLTTTLEFGERELQLVQSQEAYAHPRMQFEVRQVR